MQTQLAETGFGLVQTLPASAGLAMGSGPDAGSAPTEASGVVGRTMPHGAGLRLVDPSNYANHVELSRGGMGRIAVAHDRRLGRSVALKELHTDTAELRARFEREALLTARLEHPSIVSIHEAGRWPNGQPFYAMRLVRGRSLDRVIESTHSLDQRLALLPNVLAVADALAYAHQEQIIHRDLKPNNVMVGEFGETVVIDWGLGKDLRSNAPEPSHAPVDGTAGATEIGAILGTPAYMPPEQAEGEAVDARADVYAIGAILYHVLAGAPPYEGRTAAALLDAVTHGPPMPLGRREPGVPVDLLAIVERAMARDASQRYADARGLADDLRRFLAGQLVSAHRYSRRQLLRRWVRRHRTPVAAVGLAAVVVAIVGTVSVRRVLTEEHVAKVARAQAETDRAGVEDWMGFVLGDLRDKLRAVGKVELLDDVATRAQDYYKHRAPAQSVDDQNHRIQTFLEIADVRFAQHHLDEALDLHGKALAAATRLATEAPQSHFGLRDQSLAHRGLARVLLAKGEPDRALAELDLALTASKQLSAKDPAKLEWMRDVAGCHTAIASLALTRGDGTMALAALTAAADLDAKLVAGAPDNLEWKRDFAGTRNQIGHVLFAKGDVDGALVEFRAGLASAEELVKQDPKNMTWKRDVSVRHDDVGQALLAKGDVAGTLAEYRASMTITQQLVDLDPTRARDLLVSHSRLAEVLTAQGDARGALVETRAQLVIAQRLAAIDPGDAAAQGDLLSTYAALGSGLLATKDPRSAIAAFRAGISIGEHLTAHDPTNVAIRNDLATAHQGLGLASLARRDRATAATAFRAAIAIVESMMAAAPDNAGLNAALVELRGQLARARHR